MQRIRLLARLTAALVAAALVASAVLAACSATAQLGAPTSTALQFVGTTTAGEQFDARTLGRGPAVLWFWAPWCSECAAEAESIAAAHAQFGDAVPFVGVPSLGGVPEMQDFVATHGLGSFPHVVDAEGEVWAAFRVSGQPAHAFVGADGDVELVRGPLDAGQLAERVAALVEG